jgi:hypothetical protein
MVYYRVFKERARAFIARLTGKASNPTAGE